MVGEKLMTAKKADEKDKILLYKGKPLIRSQNTIYYGDITQKYIIMMQILSAAQVGDLNVATKVAVQLVLTDDNIKLKDRIIKKIEKPGLYPAMDIGSIWLERANAAG